jgi:hypothetical protein
MEKIPTAEELLKSKQYDWVEDVDTLGCMIEFAKLHVEAALKAVSENVQLMAVEARWELPENADNPFDYVEDDLGNITTIDKKTILNAYPLENIK